MFKLQRRTAFASYKLSVSNTFVQIMEKGIIVSMENYRE